MLMYAYVCMYVYLHMYVIKINESSIPLSTRPTRGDPGDCIKLYYIHYYTFTHSCASYSQTLLHLVYLVSFRRNFYFNHLYVHATIRDNYASHVGLPSMHLPVRANPRGLHLSVWNHPASWCSEEEPRPVA